MKQQNLFKQSLNPVRNTYNCFVVFIQTLKVDLDYPVRVIGKNLTLPKHEDIILNSLTQVREKWVSLFLRRANFWTVWECHGIWCFHFHFFRINFRHCYGNFFESTVLQVRAMFKVPSQQLRGKMTKAFKRYLTVEYFTEMDQGTC